MVSSCWWARVRDPGGTGEWLCTECHEHCTDESEDEIDQEMMQDFECEERKMDWRL